MKEAPRAALIAELVRKLRDRDSWAGETHVQKTSYFLQEMMKVPLELRFTLYKFGPFSFDLRDQLTEMRSLDQLALEPQPRPYGPKLTVGNGVEQLRTRFPKTLRRYDGALEFVADEIGVMGVGPLERLATALMVSRELPGAPVEERAQQLHRYKAHVGMEQAREAVLRVDGLRDQAEVIKPR